ncbi:hypothetical protein [Pseudomonas caricapapayae]|uniref:hypothetical protein n=1 Tax=Pseudomonas caricapapayae TaxID=46678 RepID=UPI001239C73E|nr:hypothetical protein [Pseudomonas caricapapayae]KAA8684544.1 hypothetical protein F4W67_29960 [Pseudomonas caricapapayae]
MTTTNRTIPLSLSDSLIDVRYALEAYHQLSQAFIEKLARDCSNGDAHAVVNGSEALFRPIMDSLSDFIDQVDSVRKSYAQIDLEASEGPSHA